MKTFDHEWIFDAFAGHRTFFSKRMFGGLAAYVFDRLQLVLVEPTKTGRWTWHGVLVCTSREHHTSIQTDFPALKPHDVLGKWLYLDSVHDDFEQTLEGVASRIARNDPRFGILPAAPKARTAKRATKRTRPMRSRPRRSARRRAGSRAR